MRDGRIELFGGMSGELQISLENHNPVSKAVHHRFDRRRRNSDGSSVTSVGIR